MGSTPPDWRSGPPRPRPRTLWGDLGNAWARIRTLPAGLQVAMGAVVAIAIVWLLSVAFKSEPTSVSSRSTTTVRVRTLPPTTTTTTLPLPAGDDRTVQNVLDGDSLQLTDGTRIRLIGIDAPDIETSDCFSTEATTHLKELLPTGRNVRVAYDQSKTDRLGRTLAYVYSLPDGLFINVAMARDGYAIQLTTPPNTLHADQVGAAVNEARNARRGLWQTCQSATTTSTTRATTTASATTVPTATTSTTAGPTTSTTVETSTTSSSTTTTTEPDGPGPVVRDAPCTSAGATATFSDGTLALCAQAPDGQLRWLSA